MDMYQDLPYTYPSQPVEYIPHRLQSDGRSCWIVTNRHLPLHCSSSQLQSIDSRNVVVVRNYLSQVLCDLWSSYTFRFCNSFSWAVYMVPLLLSWTLRHLWSYWLVLMHCYRDFSILLSSAHTDLLCTIFSKPIPM